MPSELHEFLSRDHARLDALLQAALKPDGTIDEKPYTEFRGGLLRHIGIEEKVLFPEMKRRDADAALQQQLHRDHAALAALLVPPPTREIIETIRELLDEHNPLEEESGGLYEIVEGLSGDALSDLMVRVRATPPVPLAPHYDTPVVRKSIEQLLREAREGRRFLRRRGNL